MPEYSYHHIHLVSPDPLKTAEFYENMFNAKRLNATESADGRTTSVALSLNGSSILIMLGKTQQDSTSEPSAPTIGLEHFGIITDDLETAVADLKAKGVQFRNDPREFRPGVNISFLWAPENVLIELLEIKKK